MITDFTRRWPEIEPLIDQLFEVPAAQREDWLRQHCADHTLRALVAQALDQAPGIEALERGMVQWLPSLVELPAALPLIPGYRVLRFAGAGGMASVFEAERELPGGPQKVALKLLRIDVHDLDERRRFLREQRILARLQHPHIAQLLDAGFSPAGTPYLALEFVAGANIVRYCGQHELGMGERLALFIDVSTAVEHAHRSLIVHCDLKPGNVLVGADGCIKLVDFGIAKLLTGDGEQTRTEAVRLTRAYAAPEQLAGAPATTLIDVYALGILLAELLGGLQPRRVDERVDAGVSAFDDEMLRRKLGVDLHAIVRAATHPDPARRYASATALREDVERYLDGRPLQARADTFAYRVLMLARRHVVAVAASALVIAILAGATAISLHESSLAGHAARNAQTQALAAEGEAQRANALKSFLEGLFDNAPHGTQASATAELLLARGRERADRDFANQPALRVEILALIGDLERRSGHPDRAQQPLEEAAALAKAKFGVTDTRTLHVEYLLAEEADGRGRFRAGATRLQHAIEAFDAGPNHDSPEQVQALAWLAGLDERIGESGQAIGLGEKALVLARRILPNDSAALTDAVMNLGWILMDAGHPDRAEPLLREALARQRRRLGADHPDVADAMAILTTALIRLGHYGESEQLMRDALAIDATAYTGPNAHLAWHLNDLGNVLMLEGRLDEAAAMYARSMAVNRALAPASTLDAAISVGNMARLRLVQGAYAEAESGFRDAIDRKQRLLGTDYDDNLRSYDRASLAEVLIARGRLDQARTLADSALAEVRQQHRGAHPDVAYALTVEARWMAASGNRGRAAVFAGDAVAMYSALADQRSDKAIRARLLYGEILQALGRGSEASAQLQKALAAAEAITPKAAALVAHIEAELACVDVVLGEHAAAARLRVEAEASLAAIPAGPNSERDATMQRLAVRLATMPTRGVGG